MSSSESDKNSSSSESSESANESEFETQPSSQESTPLPSPRKRLRISSESSNDEGLSDQGEERPMRKLLGKQSVTSDKLRSKDYEIWLLKLPHNFKPENLEDMDIPAENGVQVYQETEVKGFEINVAPSNHQNKVVLLPNKDGLICPVGCVTRQLTVTSTIKSDDVIIPPEKLRAPRLPSGLKNRCYALGAEKVVKETASNFDPEEKLKKRKKRSKLTATDSDKKRLKSK